MQRVDWAVVVSSFDLADSSSKVVGLPVEVGDTVKILEKLSDKWWLCSDGEEMGYLPPSCLLQTTPGSEEMEEDSSSERELVSILRSVEADSGSAREEPKRRRKVSFSAENKVHVIPRDESAVPRDESAVPRDESMVPRDDSTSLDEESRYKYHDSTTTPSGDTLTLSSGGTRLRVDRNLLAYLAPVLKETQVTKDEQGRTQLKIPTRKLLKKTYGYFSNPQYKSGYDRHHTNRCDKDACHFWRDQSHDNCVQTGEFIAPEEGGLVKEGVSFISGLFGGLKEEEEAEEEDLNRSSFNLMSLLISD